VLLIVGLGLLPLGVAWHYGATGLVRNDDWSYSEILFRWVDTGHLELNGWVSMFLVGQLALAWPVARVFPHSLLALQVFTSLVGIAGALAAYAFLRRFLTRGRATAAVVLLMSGPLWGPLAGSFMTDVPAAAAEAGCLALGAVALTSISGRRSTVALTAALAVGLVGATIREYAIVAPLVVVAVVAVRAGARGQRRAVLVTLGLAGVVSIGYAAAFGWRRGLSGRLSLTPTIPDAAGSAFGRSALFTVVTLAFLILPTFAWVRWRTLVTSVMARRWTTVAVGASVVLGLAGLVRVWTWSPPLLGPYLDQRGALGDDVLLGSSRPLLLPSWLLRGLLGLTVAAAIALMVVVASTAAAVLPRPRPPAGSWRAGLAGLDARALCLAFVVASAVGVVAVGTSDLPVFDRYVMCTVPFAAGLVLAHRSAAATTVTRTVVAAGAVAAFAVLGLWWTGDSAAFDAARWQAGQRAVALGYPADRIDAGFEWRNAHRRPGALATAPSEHDPDACVRIEAGDVGADPGTRLLFTTELGRPFAGNGPLRALATGAAGCP